jgi:hypothetical protein
VTATASPNATTRGQFRDLSAEETSTVSGGLGPFAFFVVMAVCRFGFAHARHEAATPGRQPASAGPAAI